MRTKLSLTQLAG